MVQFLAFSLQDQVEKYGAYVGVAAFFGLAVLTILYFSQARELRRLRDWAGRAPERAAEQEARVVAQAEAARRVQDEPIAARPAGVGAVTAAAAAAGGATAVTAGGGEQATQVVEAGQSGNGTAAAAEDAEAYGPKTEAQAAADAEAEAETPDSPESPEDASAEAEEGAEAADGDGTEGEEPEAESPEEPAAEPEPESFDEEPSEEPAAEGGIPEPVADAPQESETPPVEDETPEPVGGARAAGSGNGGAPGEIPVAPVPRATPLPRREPAPAAPLRQPSRSATVPPRRPAPPRRGAPAAKQSSSSPSRAPLIGVGLGVLVVAVIALFATGVIGGDDSKTPPAPNTTSNSSSTTTPSENGGGDQDTLTAADTKVAVLNGTTIPGLASTEKDKLSEAGFSGSVTTGNNTDQQRGDSSVLYGTRSGARTQARKVAQELDISDVRRLDADTRELGENADVVVILGQDKAP